MNGLVEKSEAAARSARLLFDNGDFDGAVSRAYYAMFDAAGAYLQRHHAVDLNRIKTHAGVLTTFNALAVNKDARPAELLRIINRAAAQRKQADYDEQSVSRAAASNVIEEMASFLELIMPHLGRAPKGFDS